MKQAPCYCALEAAAALAGAAPDAAAPEAAAAPEPAAVAVGYAQAVTNPCCGNIGGGGFMTVHLADGRDRFINFRET
ncbi:gamma-glutamyltransferase, partial [Burkholderia sp. Ac-20345]|uniref:gamma-glutamyltransferase n=1 Tax=Burkholderia sp. Ac-20345 TaxID=2703891 RepID=UPI00197C4B77